MGYGRGLQSVNILLNSGEDKTRGVSFYPTGWTDQDMIVYCRRGLGFAHEYMKTLKQGTAAYSFCLLPLMLAEASLTAKEKGEPKLKREQVVEIVQQSKEQTKVQSQ